MQQSKKERLMIRFPFLNEYLKNKSGLARGCCEDILEILLDNEHDQIQNLFQKGTSVGENDIEPMRSCELISRLPGDYHPMTIFRELDELSDYQIIKKIKRINTESSRHPEKKKKEDVYYRLPFGYPGLWTMSKKELIHEWFERTRYFIQVSNKLNAAYMLLREKGMEDPKSEVKNRVKIMGWDKVEGSIVETEPPQNLLDLVE